MKSVEQNNHEVNPIERMFALKLSDVYGGQDDELWDQVETDWDKNPVQVFVQDDIEGTVTSDSFIFSIGSWVGQRVMATVSTEDGPREVPLRLQEEEIGLPMQGNEPKPLFRIRPQAR